jgi:hypothetical protein
VRLLVQAFQADRFQVVRHLGLDMGRRHRLLGPHLHQGVQHRGSLEGRPAREHLVQDRSQRVDVCRRTDLLALALRLFGGHVTGRPHDDPAVGLMHVEVELLGEAEVGDLGYRPLSVVRCQSSFVLCH